MTRRAVGEYSFTVFLKLALVTCFAVGVGAHAAALRLA